MFFCLQSLSAVPSSGLTRSFASIGISIRGLHGSCILHRSWNSSEGKSDSGSTLFENLLPQGIQLLPFAFAYMLAVMFFLNEGHPPAGIFRYDPIMRLCTGQK
jgi:hypothetical protein